MHSQPQHQIQLVLGLPHSIHRFLEVQVQTHFVVRKGQIVQSAPAPTEQPLVDGVPRVRDARLAGDVAFEEGAEGHDNKEPH